MIRTLIAYTMLVLLMGCQGVISRSPPVHLNPNMDQQSRYNAQDANGFFADGRAMRPLVPGTIARGTLKEDEVYYTGMKDATYVHQLPMPITSKLLKRGQERYAIHCAVCHDGAGTGRGIVVQRGMIPPPSFHTDRVRQMPVGQYFEVITHGVRTMPSYGKYISVEDRWALSAYIRALQMGQNASLSHVPADQAAAKGWHK